MTAFKKKKIVKPNKIRIHAKIRVFNAYVLSIFLYNAELGTLTKSKEEKIDGFQKSS